LPGSLKYTAVPLEKGRQTKIPVSVTLGFQPYRHVDHLEYMNTAELADFVKYWRNSLDMITQRCGLMYGYFREDKNFEEGCRAVLEGIYEPPQTPVGDSVQMLDDPKKEIVTRITDRLGLEPIGWIFTGLPREEFLTSSDVSTIARLQMQHTTTTHFTKFPLSKFVTCVIRPDPEQEGRPTPNVFMVSDQCVAMMRDDLIGDSPDPKYCVVKDQGKNMLMPSVLESGKPTKKFDPDWFLVRVGDGAPKKVRSMFKHATFPRENRQPPQKRDDLKNYFRKVSQSEPTWSRFADFHLILYLAQEFDIDTALDICDGIRDRKEISAGTMEMIQALIA
jgi:nuclear protein localization family protein 4